MDTAEFETQLKDAGYREIGSKTLEPRPANGEHGHEYSVRGLVTAGEFIITLEGIPRSFKPGQIFEVAAGALHSEALVA